MSTLDIAIHPVGQRLTDLVIIVTPKVKTKSEQNKVGHRSPCVPKWIMEVLLFVTAILVSGAGSLVSVVAANHLESLSFSAIVHSFDALPATSRAALIMVGLAAFIIPIGTLVAGDGLADLTLEQGEQTDFRERQWQEVEFTIVYRAVFVRYMQTGLDERDARRRALSEVKGYLGTGQSFRG